ncbi:MAG: hypothetical protein NDJ89_14255 [Oligoflexia bacterium]|nr:hypothetical protein [Oligoflexia bacterium]
MVRFRFGNLEGFSLVQVLIGMGLLGVLGLLFAQITTQSLKGQSAVRGSSELNHLVDQVTLVLQNPTVCSSNLTAANLSSVSFDSSSGALPGQVITINRITLPSGSVIAEPGMKISSGLVLMKLELRGFQELSAGTHYLAMVRLEAKREQNSAIGSPILTRDVPLTLATHIVSGTTAQIDQCGSGGTLAKLLCESTMGGVYDPAPPPGAPSCRLKIHSKWYVSAGVRWTTDNAMDAGVFLPGTAPHSPEVSPGIDGFGSFYNVFAPDCPSGTQVTGCAVKMGGKIVTSQFISNGPTWSRPHIIRTELDYSDLDSQGRPRCKLRLRNVYATDYFPAIQCSSSSAEALP